MYDCDKSTDSAPKIKDYFKPSSEKPKYKHDHPKQKQFRHIIVEWVILKKVVQAFLLADEKLKMPTRAMNRRDIIKLHREKKARVIEELSFDDWLITDDM